MLLESTLDTYKYNFKHPIVRDLAWAIASPPMVEKGEEELISYSWLAQQYTTYLPRLFALDNDPSSLTNFIQHSKRLGVYFEQLWHFFFLDNPNFEVLLANAQVRDQYQTYGEFDFIVRDKTTNLVTHFEVAVKFYLGYPYRDNAEPLWYGANIRDRFDIKFNHMLQRQIKLGHLACAKTFLKKHNIAIDNEKIILKGRLYQPHPTLPLTKQSTVHNSCNWRWLTTSRFKQRYANYAWYRVMKPDYLAPRLPEEVHYWESNDEKKPLQILRYEDKKEAERLMLVPDEWLTKLQLTIQNRADLNLE